MLSWPSGAAQFISAHAQLALEALSSGAAGAAVIAVHVQRGQQPLHVAAAAQLQRLVGQQAHQVAWGGGEGGREEGEGGGGKVNAVCSNYLLLASKRIR